MGRARSHRLGGVLVHGAGEVLGIGLAIVLQPFLDVGTTLGGVPDGVQQSVGGGAGAGLQKRQELRFAHLSGSKDLGIIVNDDGVRMFSGMTGSVLLCPFLCGRSAVGELVGSGTLKGQWQGTQWPDRAAMENSLLLVLTLRAGAAAGAFALQLR